MLNLVRKLRYLPSSTQYFQMRRFSEVVATENKVEEISSDMTPKKIVEYLDKFIIGQQDAKKAMAIALSIITNSINPSGNRWRRKKLPEELKEEIYPKNILMVGPTGCGKTEIARRLAKMNDAPFIKVEATKYTEVGYHGRDVDDIIKDLVATTVKQFKNNLSKEIEKRKGEMEDIINTQILHCLLGPNITNEELKNDKFAKIKEGLFDERYVTCEIPNELYEKKKYRSIEDLLNFIKAFKPTYSNKAEKETLKIKQLRTHYKDLILEKINKDIDNNKIAIQKIEQEGIVFIDEIDKIASPEDAIIKEKSPSAEGVQRDLLPLIEGTIVHTKYGDVKTDHILFVGSGAFSNAKPTDLIPELLGRLPIRVELKALTRNDFKRILTEPKFNLIFQNKELLKQEGLDVTFSQEAIDEIAKIAEDFNLSMENVGARRLHAILEKILEEVSYEGPDNKDKEIKITDDYVRDKLKHAKDKTDLSRYLI